MPLNALSVRVFAFSLIFCLTYFVYRDILFHVVQILSEKIAYAITPAGTAIPPQCTTFFIPFKISTAILKLKNTSFCPVLHDALCT